MPFFELFLLDEMMEALKCSAFCLVNRFVCLFMAIVMVQDCIIWDELNFENSDLFMICLEL